MKRLDTLLFDLLWSAVALECVLRNRLVWSVLQAYNAKREALERAVRK